MVVKPHVARLDQEPFRLPKAAIGMMRNGEVILAIIPFLGFLAK